MTVVSTHISIITLNANGLNSPMKRHRMAGCIKKQDPTTYYYNTFRRFITALKTNVGAK